jgi:hypothetical protein
MPRFRIEWYDGQRCTFAGDGPVPAEYADARLMEPYEIEAADSDAAVDAAIERDYPRFAVDHEDAQVYADEIEESK